MSTDPIFIIVATLFFVTYGALAVMAILWLYHQLGDAIVILLLLPIVGTALLFATLLCKELARDAAQATATPAEETAEK